MIDAPNLDKIEESNDWKRLSLEGLSTGREELAADLALFESQYGMTSSDFNERFESGELGDEMDYFDWSAAFRMFTRIQSEKAAPR